ncbi:CoA-binding protein [Radiobacillus sp. PE A8.2]|uniref:CoA-binding protein n=1 Tax=Radiobacillus sp. PE A8.2 TaxID=3380349 RepID=UPI0038905B64
MSYTQPPKEQLKEILENAKTIAVVGLSNSSDRTSYQIARAMQQAGYKIIPVNPHIDSSLGEKAYPSLSDVKDDIDIINVFRRSEYLPDLAKEAVKTDARVFWAQQGIYNEEAYQYLKEHDFTVLMDLCIKVAHALTIGK